MKKELKFYNAEFEQVVSHELLVSDRPITDEDALKIFDLDWFDFTFDSRDYEALYAFKNLDYLTINTRADELDFLDSFSDNLIVGLYGIKVKNGIDYSKLSRFADEDFDEIESTYW